ncbi:hypothetical protein G7054_g6916 [Neopestalotiopsis clavispora]|nr:hypothetical protein G7054_g6916 [Neopestalotiopsis clavispora]
MASPATIQPNSADGLWKSAYDSLDDGLRASIAGARTGRNDILAAVLKTAGEKREICIRKQWKVKLPSGEVIVIRDVVEKIAKWVNAFIAVGDVAVQYDPATAALPWAAVRFVLQAAVSDTQIEGAMVANLEVISRLIARYRDFEKIHRDSKSSVASQINEALTRLYVNVLKFLAIAVRTLISPARGIKNVFRTPDESLMESIIQKEAELLKIAGFSDSEKLYYLEDSVARLVDQAAVYQTMVDDTKHLELLHWLSSSPFTRHHEAISEQRMSNSATWLLRHSEYRNWKASSSSSILLVHGIQGSGKSNICSAVIDSFLNEHTANPLAAPIAYFYCAEHEFEPERAQAGNVLRSLLRQLTITTHSKPKARDIILSDFERRLAQSKVDGMDMSKLNIKDCVDVILEVTNHDPVVVVVDALDEVRETERPALIGALEELVVKSSNVVKVFLTSRNDSQVFSLLRKRITEIDTATTQQHSKAHVKYIEISKDDNLEDIGNYVKMKVLQAVEDRRLLKRDPTSELTDLLHQKLIIGAGEMFQWVNIQIEYLCRYNREEDIRAAMESGTLASLEDTYQQVLDRISSKRHSERDIAIRAITWLLYMREAMHPDDLLAAILENTTIADPSRSREELVTICSSFVLFDPKCNTFRFSHQSVQEFLRDQELFSPPLAHQLLATRCLEVCTHGASFEDGLDGDGMDGLYRYAAVYWAYHCSLSADPDGKNALLDNILSFVCHEPGNTSISFIGWLDHIQTISASLPDEHSMKTITNALPNPQSSPLFLGSAFGLDCLLDDVVMGPEPIDWDQKNNIGHTSLYLACACGKLSTASALLAHGADPNSKCGKFGNPLQAACFAGHNPVVELLLKHGALFQQTGAFNNALEACFRGQREDTAKIVISLGFGIGTAEDFHSAQAGAAYAGFLEVLDFLKTSPLASKYNSDSKDNIKRNTENAIKGGNAGALRAFLRNKPDPADLLPEGPIAISVIYRHESVVTLLINMGLNLEVECKLGSPLRCAALMGHERIMLKLIELGANVNGHGQHGTALQAASMKGHLGIVKLLLQNGAEINHENIIHGTSLQIAAFYGHRDIVETLLDAGANMHPGDPKDSKDALYFAAKGGHYNIVKLLLDRGFTFRRPWGRALCAPSAVRYKPLLRDHSPSREESRALWRHNVHKEMFSIYAESHEISFQDIFTLIEENADRVSATRQQHSKVAHSGGQTSSNRRFRHVLPMVLPMSAGMGRKEIVALLVEWKSALGISDDELSDSLEAAAESGQLEIFQLFFTNLSSPLSQERLLEILQAAASNDHLGIVQFGIESLSSSNWDPRDFQALVTLACLTSEPAVQNMLSLATEIILAQETASILATSLIEAAGRGGTQVVALLLDHLGKLPKRTAHAAFEAACDNGHHLVVQALLNAVDDNVSIELANKGLLVGAWRGHTDIVALLARQLLPRDSEANIVESMLLAAGNGHLETLEVLLRSRESWNGLSGDATRALGIAACNGHEEVVQALLKAGADINATESDVTRILSWGEACAYRLYRRGWDSFSQPWPRIHDDDEEGVEESDSVAETEGEDLSHPKINALQAAIAGIEARNSIRSTSSLQPRLVRNWKKRSVSDLEGIVKALLYHGADSNSLGGREEPPIIIASRCCSETILSCLIESGAKIDVMIKDTNAVLAATQSELSGGAVLRRLLEAGASINYRQFSIEQLLGNCLEFFADDGHFVQIERLEDAFVDGPGTSAKILIKELPPDQASQIDFRGLLQSAIVIDERECVELLLEKDVDINAVGCYYGTALQAAARFGRFELTKRLLEAGANPNVLEGQHKTALRAAVIGRHTTIVKLLIQYGADVNCGHHNALWDLAAGSSHANIISTLVATRPDVGTGSPDSMVHHPLILACDTGNHEVVKYLLEAGAPIGVPGKSYPEPRHASPLHAACYQGNPLVIHILIERGAEANNRVQDSPSPLQLAAQRGHIAATCLLLGAGAEVDCVSKDGRSALSEAAGGGHLSVVKELLAWNATIWDGKRQSALKSACHSRSTAVLEVLLDAVSRTDNSREALMETLESAVLAPNNATIELLGEYMDPSPDILHKASIAGSPSLVIKTLNQGISVDAKDNHGNTALILASYHLQVKVVEVLVRRGADIGQSQSIYGSALGAAFYGCIEPSLPQGAKVVAPMSQSNSPRHHWPVWGVEALEPKVRRIMKCQEAVQFLLSQGAAVEVEPREFGSPLHLASFLGSSTLIRALLSTGADIQSEGGYFKTPLFAAIMGGQIEAVKLLLEDGAQVNYSHPELGTPLFLACQESALHIAQVIFDAGGNPNILGPNDTSSLSCVFASKSYDHRELVLTFLNYSEGLKIHPDDLVKAVKAPEYYRSFLKDLLEHDKNTVVPEEAVVATLDGGNGVEEYLTLLLSRIGNHGVTKAMLLAAEDHTDLSTLLRYSPVCPITIDIIMESYSVFDVEIIDVFLLHEPTIAPTEAMVIKALKSSSEEGKVLQTLSRIWARSPDLEVTNIMLEVRVTDFPIMKFLISHAKKDLRISQAMLLPERNYMGPDADSVRCLLRHDPGFVIIEELTVAMLRAENRIEILDILLEHSADIDITPPIFLAFFRGRALALISRAPET